MTSCDLHGADSVRRLGAYKFTAAALLTVVYLFSMAGCLGGNRNNTPSRDEGPFSQDRIATVRIAMSEEDWASSRASAMEKQYVKADLSYDGTLIQGVAVRPKGNSSLMVVAASNAPRLSLKVDFDYYNPGCNFYGLKKISFNNGFSDPTFMREFLGYELFREMGVPAPRTSFVDLWVNDTHLGLYTMVEQVDNIFLGSNFDDAGGNLYKPEGLAASLSWTEADLEKQRSSDESADSRERTKGMAGNMGRGLPAETEQGFEPEEAGGDRRNAMSGFMPQNPMMLPGGMRPGEDFQLPEGFSPPEGFPDIGGLGAPGGRGMQGFPGGATGDYLEQMDLKTNEDNPDHALLFRLLDILNNEPDETFPDEIEKVLDVDNILRFLAVSAAVVHLDNYIGLGHNYYLYDNSGKFVIIPWDLNMVFGTFNLGLDRDKLINFYIDEPTGGPAKNKPLATRLLSHQPYLDAYHGYLEEFMNGPFNIDRMSVRIDEMAQLLRPFVAADELKFFTTEEFERSLAEDLEPANTDRFMPGALSNPIGIKTFVMERSESIRGQLDGSMKSRSDDGSGNGGGFLMPGFQGDMSPPF